MKLLCKASTLTAAKKQTTLFESVPESSQFIEPSFALNPKRDVCYYLQYLETLHISQEIEEKTERLVRLMSDEGLSGIFINSQHNFAWFTGGHRNGIDVSREAGAGILFVRRDGTRFLLASVIELDRLMTEELYDQGYEGVEFSWEEEKANPTLAADVARSLVANKLPLGSDLPLGESVRVVETALARARYELTPAEVERYRALGQDAGTAIGGLARKLSPGLSEREVARRANDALAAVGAYSIVTLVAADDRLRRFRHPVPTDLKWQKVLMIVVCARRAGLTTSLSRILCAGAIPEELDLLTHACAFVNAHLFNATAAGISGRELYQVAARAYADAGFPEEIHLHHQGGATGYRTRDWVAHPECLETVRNQQAFAWNPSITGSKTEETCIASEDGIEIITASPDWPSILIKLEGSAYVLPGILSL